jgi:hypothetical protein
MKICSPTLLARFTLRPIASLRCSRAHDKPMWKALRLGLRSFSLPLYCSPIRPAITSGSMPSMPASAPT